MDTLRENPRSEHELPASYRQPAPSSANVGPAERVISTLIGTAVLAIATRKGGARGLLAGIVGSGLVYRGVTGRCTAYRMLEENNQLNQHRATGVPARQGVRFKTSLIVQRPAAEIYRFWRRLTNLPHIVDHLESVTSEGTRSHWVARGPWQTPVEWDAEIIEDRADELIAWRSLPGSELDTAGSVHFEELPHERGTAVRVSLKYDPPGGRPAAWLASWLGSDVETSLHEGMRRMKQLLETGEITSVRNQPQGRCGGRS